MYIPKGGVYLLCHKTITKANNMELKRNGSIDYTAQINDTFFNLQRSEWSGENYFYEKETALTFKITTDFRTRAECVSWNKHIAIRYNWQIKKLNSCFYNYKMDIILNLN